MTAILHKRNSTPGLPPSPPSLSAGEIAINIADGNLFTKTTNGSIKTFLNSDNDPFVLNKSLSSIKAQNGGNSVTGLFAGALGGYNNNVVGSGSSIVNGESNQVAGDYASVIGGLNNFVGLQGDYSAILGGKNNTLTHPESFILGSNITSHLSGFTYIDNLSVLGKIYGDGSSIAGLGNGGIVFALTSVTTTTYNQDGTYTHTLYNDTVAGGQITVALLPPASHSGVTQHKKIGTTASIVLSAPSGVTIDGQPTFALTSQYQSIGLFTDGVNYFIE